MKKQIKVQLDFLEQKIKNVELTLGVLKELSLQHQESLSESNDDNEHKYGAFDGCIEQFQEAIYDFRGYGIEEVEKSTT